MLKKVKKALGIEGVKLQVVVPAQSPKVTTMIKGSIVLTSLSDNTVEHIDISFYERYSRGRKKDRLVNDYQIGKITLEGPIHIEAGGKVEVPFSLPYVIAESDMDKMARNPLLGGLIAFARKLKKVSSVYRLVAEATVIGTKLAPFDETEIELIGKS